MVGMAASCVFWEKEEVQLKFIWTSVYRCAVDVCETPTNFRFRKVYDLSYVGPPRVFVVELSQRVNSVQRCSADT